MNIGTKNGCLNRRISGDGINLHAAQSSNRMANGENSILPREAISKVSRFGRQDFKNVFVNRVQLNVVLETIFVWGKTTADATLAVYVSINNLFLLILYLSVMS